MSDIGCSRLSTRRVQKREKDAWREYFQTGNSAFNLRRSTGSSLSLFTFALHAGIEVEKRHERVEKFGMTFFQPLRALEKLLNGHGEKLG